MIAGYQQESQLNDTRSRRDHSKARRRRNIIEIAQKKFLKDGYAATTMSSIAKELGGSKGTLWSYFPCKEAIYSAAVENATHSVHDDLAVALGAGIDIDRNLHAFAEIFLNKLMEPASIALSRLVVSEASRFPELGKIFHELAFMPAHEKLSTFFLEEIASGRMRPCDPGHAAIELMSLLQRPQQFLLWSVDMVISEGNVGTYLYAAVETFLRAYRC